MKGNGATYERLRLEQEESEVFNRGKSAYWAGGCYGVCGDRVWVVDGSQVAIESVPESDAGGKGGTCGKGRIYHSGLPRPQPDQLTPENGSEG